MLIRRKSNPEAPRSKAMSKAAGDTNPPRKNPSEGLEARAQRSGRACCLCDEMNTTPLDTGRCKPATIPRRAMWNSVSRRRGERGRSLLRMHSFPLPFPCYFRCLFLSFVLCLCLVFPSGGQGDWRAGSLAFAAGYRTALPRIAGGDGKQSCETET